MKKRLVIGNWKMYVDAPLTAAKFAATLRKQSRLYKGVEVVIAPPFPLIGTLATAFKGSSIRLGAQAVSPFTEEKHTGEVSASTLKKSGVTSVIIGHSERRAAGESEESIRLQITNALKAGLSVVLCVGERERDPAGAHFTLITEQLTSALAAVAPTQTNRLVIAYEPVWAIGKSAADAMKASDVREMSIFIKKTLAERFERAKALKIPILYGGSVEAENAGSLITEGDVAGFLVGHASASTDTFLPILHACKK